MEETGAEPGRGAPSRSADEALASAVVRVAGQDGTVCGAGALVAPDLVLTCAHVVSDALGRPRRDVVAAGAVVVVDFPLAGWHAAGAGRRTAEVERWIPIRPDRTGDVALLRLRDPVPGTRPLPMVEPDRVWEHGARAVGFTGAEPTVLWFRGRLSGATEEGWLQLSRAGGQETYVRKGFSGSPVWDNELGAAVGLVVAAQPEQETQQVFVLRTATLVREIPELAGVLLPAAPFRGLTALQEDDADVFFGRDDEVDETVAALRGHHGAVTVYGPSGCGKSSLALAGVVPRMRREGHEVLVVDFGGTASPRAVLATELFEAARSGRHGPSRADSADQVEQWLDGLGLTGAFHRATGRRPARLLVVLDQAEALLNRPEPEIAQAVALLFPERQPAGLRVLLTLRADFMDAALSHPRLGPALRRGVTLPLTPMTRDQLHAVITEPVKAVPAVAYDPGLVARILDDAGDEPGVLPLLGFVLEQLWEHRAGGRLRAVTYEELGGVAGALRRHAESAWRACVRPEDEARARPLLTGLVRVLPGGEAPMRRVLTREEAGEEPWRLVRALAERRLLVLYGGDGRPESAELSHEALITAWPALAEEVRAGADFLAGRAEVQHDLERWRNADGAADLLPGPLQLAAVEARLRGREAELTAEQREFLARARRRRRVRLARARAGWVAGALALALIAALVTFLVQESNVSERRAAEGRSRALAVQSDELTETNPGQAALAALAAYETAPTQEARSALMRRYDALRDAAWMLTGAEGKNSAAAMSADGAVTLVTSENGRATLFVRSAAGEVRQEPLRLADNVVSPVVSRDGQRIAYVIDKDGTVVWHDVTPSGKRLAGPPHRLRGALTARSLGLGTGNMKIMDFSPDARRLVGVSAADAALPVQVWDLDTGRPRALPERVARLTEVWFGPDGNTLVALHSPATGKDSALVAVDIAAGTVRELAAGLEHDGHAVSGDGGVAVVCRKGRPDPDTYGTARYEAVRVADGRVLRRFDRGKGTWCVDVSVSEKGERFAVMGESDSWSVVGTGASARTDGPATFFGPLTTPHATARLPLLGTASDPVVVTKEGNAITGWALTVDDGGVAFSPPQLVGDGSRMVVRVGRNSESLRLMETEGKGRVLAEARTPADTPPDATQQIQVNRAATLVADVSDRNRITVRALPSLRRVAEFTAARPPAGNDGKPELLKFYFIDDDRLITVAGPYVEHWDAHDGRRLTPPIDLRDLALTEQARPTYFVGRHSEPGHIGVTVGNEPDVHAVDLATGKETEKLRIRLGPDLNVAVFLRDPHYMAVMTTGGMVELWSVRPGQPARRVVGPLGPLNPNRWAAGLTTGAGFFLANNSSVHFLRADDPGFRESYRFAERQGFLAAADDGRALLRSPATGGRIGLVRLDPALWKRHVCAVLGRGLTADERGGLPPGLPADICPAPR
ncbi:trypsin-like peptidase domain-containing protein [Streptomyces sp. CC208A]|uniref:nSTAND1 domain-containing NTPase n=1 Tax=Streptomyces sp. CC208A TaxID=3044573 RepID=UPI0024A92821|nr:trypsin-like peptidase domain-containing protein [Streptomyces sp. CC208A]